MVTIVENVHQISIEWMNVIEFGEAINNSGQLLVDRFLHELDLAHVKLTDTLNLESLADLSGSLSLSLREDNIDEVVGLWNLVDPLEVVSALRSFHSSDTLILILTLQKLS